MKKIKWTLMSVVILASIGSAFATRPRALTSQLYYFNGVQYILAGQEGVNFVCITSTNICTYVLIGGVYTPYETKAAFTPLSLNTTDSPSTGKEK